jgi:hypothetical protein
MQRNALSVQLPERTRLFEFETRCGPLCHERPPAVIQSLQRMPDVHWTKLEGPCPTKRFQCRGQCSLPPRGGRLTKSRAPVYLWASRDWLLYHFLGAVHALIDGALGRDRGHSSYSDQKCPRSPAYEMTFRLDLTPCFSPRVRRRIVRARCRPREGGDNLTDTTITHAAC